MTIDPRRIIRDVRASSVQTQQASLITAIPSPGIPRYSGGG